MLALLLLAGPASAQMASNAVLTGTVRDAQSKQPLENVVVTATSPALQGEQIVVTDKSGLYRLPQLPPGTYVIRFESEHLRPGNRQGILLPAEVTLRVDIELLQEAATLTEEIAVEESAPVIDVGTSAVGGAVSSEFMRYVPVNRPGGLGGSARSFEAIAETLPQANSDGFGVAINGSSSPENSYQIDGVTTNSISKNYNASPMTTEFIDQITVLTGGYMPEYGRSTGGTINAITKSGGNEFHGAVWNFITPGALAARPAVAPNRQDSFVTPVSEVGNIGDFGATLGGYILKDKLWFFAGLQPSYSRYKIKGALQTLDAKGNATPVPNSEMSRFADQRQLQYIAKVTYLVNDDNRLALTVSGTPRTSGSKKSFGFNSETEEGGTAPFGTFAGQFGAVNQLVDETSTDVTLKWTSSWLGKRLLFDTVAGYHYEFTSNLPIDGSQIGSSTGLMAQPNLQMFPGPPFRQIGDVMDVSSGVSAACAQSLASGGQGCPVANWAAGGPGITDKKTGNAFNLNVTGTYFFSALGHHIFKAGYQMNASRYEDNYEFPGGPFLLEVGPPNIIIQGFDFYHLKGPDQQVATPFIDNKMGQLTAGGFVQDSWSILDVVTLNAGLRYDVQRLYDASHTVLDLPNQWSPRIGAAWDPTQSGRAKLFANYALYYQTIGLNLVDRDLAGLHASRQPATYAYRNETAAGCDPKSTNTSGCLGPFVPGYPASTNPSQIFQTYGNSRAPVDPAITAPSTEEVVAGGEYAIFRNARASLTYTHRKMLRTIEDMAPDNGATFLVGNPGFGASGTIGYPKATRTYDAVTAALVQQFSDGWVGQASYTWSRLYGNFDGLINVHATGYSQFDPNGNSAYDLRSFLPNSQGLLNNDRTHQVKLYAAKVIPLGQSALNLGAGYTGHSGTPLSYIGYDAIYNSPLVYLVERGTAGRTPWVHNLDGHLGYDYRFTKDLIASFTLDVFNIFNWQNTIFQDQTYTLSSHKTLPIPNGKPSDLAGCNNDPTSATCKLKELANGPNNPAVPYSNAGRSSANQNFLAPTQFQPPREVRFGVRLSF